MTQLTTRGPTPAISLVLFLCLTLVSGAWAGEAFLRGGDDQGAPWVTGGIGLSEREALDARFGTDFNLRIEFAMPTGNYIAQVDVRILSATGEVLLEVADVDPWLLVKLPAGRYSVQAKTQDQQFDASVQIPARGARTIVFNRWSAS